MGNGLSRGVSGRHRSRPAAIGAVLAGGASRRMGSSKATVRLAGRPLIAHALAAVQASGLDPIVVAKPSSELPELGCRVVREPEEPRHPLCGIIAALSESDGRAVVVTACDMPFIRASLIAWLASLDQPLVVCATREGLQPLLARYTPSLIEPLSEALTRGDSVKEAVQALAPRIVREPELRRFGAPERLSFNVNRPADLAMAERWAAQAHGGTR